MTTSDATTTVATAGHTYPTSRLIAVLRRWPVESLLAWSAAGIGVLSVISALTPSLKDRSELVRGLLPPGAAPTAHYGALSFGLVLIWLSRALNRRKRRAWQLALGLLVAVSAAHLAKGFDLEEAVASLALGGGLIRYRHRFQVPGDPETWRPLVAAGLGLASIGALIAVYGLHRLAVPEEMVDLAGVLGGLLCFRAVYLWFRPLGERVYQSRADRATTRSLVDRYGRDSLAFFALRRDKSYFFSPSRRAVLAYRVVGGTALVSGNPIGDRDEFRSLLEEFRRVARARGWRFAILGSSIDLLPLYRSLGLHAFRIGDEAIVRPAGFSLEGRQMRKIRQSVHRLRRAGYYVRVVAADAVDEITRRELERVSAAWLGAWPERGFTMALDNLFEPDTVFAIAECARGSVGGFLHLVPFHGKRGYSLSAMRRQPETPNGLMEFLIAETMSWGKARGVRELALNFCVFAEALRAGDQSPRRRRLARFALLKLDALFQLQRLLSFSGKFRPEWRPRFLCFERVTDFPVVGLAYLHVELLLTPPRLWARTNIHKAIPRSGRT